MPGVFTDNRGIASPRTCPGLPTLIRLQGWGIVPAVLCGFDLGGQGGYQFLHTLQDVIYAYVFGERIGQLTLSGFAFAGRCDIYSTTGVDALKYYYDANRLSVTGQPVSITLGSITSFNGLLTAFKLTLVDPDTGVMQFALQFAYPPT